MDRMADGQVLIMHFREESPSFTKLLRSGYTVYFETGVPVEFPYLRNMEPPYYYGSVYGQDIEPAGMYMILDEGWGAPRGWAHGGKRFESPLVLFHDGYGPEGWKARLSEAYDGLSGEELSRAILQDGHDGVVTLNRDEDRGVYDVSEIVDLRVVDNSISAVRSLRSPGRGWVW